MTSNDRLRFSVVEGSEQCPTVLRYCGRTLRVDRKMPGLHGFVSFVDDATDEVTMVWSGDIKDADIVDRARWQHAAWYNGYQDGRRESLQAVRDALGIRP